MPASTLARAGGLVLVDKRPGPSSFGVVRELRRRHGVKAGHAGTLDPLASGLLLVLLGPSTRLMRYLVGLDKRYVTEIELGRRTTTGDAEGDELEAVEAPTDVEAAVEALVGEIDLRVPAASAVKVGGERAYRLHRKGVAVDMPVRRTTIYAARVLRTHEALVEVELHVSSGTYVRAVADALGGHCRSLRRLAVGSFRVEDADDGRVLPPSDAVAHLPATELGDAEVGRVLSGQAVPREGDGRTRLTYQGNLVAVARCIGGEARPETVLPW